MPEQNKSKYTEEYPSEAAPKWDVKYFRILGTGALKGVEPPAGIGEELDNRLRSVRQGAIDRFPSDFEGLDINRIASFFDRRNLRRSPLIVCPIEQQDALISYLTEQVGSFGNAEIGGLYLAMLDLTVIFRNKILEDANDGPEITESLIVHEQAHGTNFHRIARTVVPQNGRDNMTTVPRRGQASHSHDKGSVGNFLEEGFADYLRGLYLEEIGMENGVLDLEGEPMIVEEDSGKEYPMALRYICAPLEGKFSVHPSSYAAMALESLLQKDPNLWPAMLKGRSNVDGLREVAQRVNAIRPGLYKVLRDSFGSEVLFQKGQAYVEDALKEMDHGGSQANM